MVNNKSEIKLLDLVNLDFLQRFQDAFAKATGVGSIMVDDKGPITKPSNFTEFCLDTMTNPQGQKKCTECDLRWGAVAAEKKEPVIYTCFAGITAFAVPIIIDDNYIASISGGLVLTKSPSEEHFRKLAQSLGIDEEEYLSTVRKIPIVSAEKVKAYADLLFIVANAISKIAHKNKELIEKNKREVLSKKMVEILRATLDSEEIKKRFIEMAFNYFGADRCLFVDYDFDKKKFLPIRLAKLKSSKLKSYIGIETESDLPEFDARLIKGKNIVIKNLEKTLARKDFSKNKSMMMLKKAGVKSDYALPVLYQNKVVGVLVLHFSTKVKILTHDEFDFLKMLRDSVGTALYQAELFEKTKKQIEREIFLRNIIETIRDSLDINETKKKIVDILGKAIGADRCFIMEYETETNSFLKIKDEYVSAPEIPAYVGNDVNIDVPNIMEAFKHGKMVIIDEKKLYLDGELQNFEQEKDAIEKFGVQGAYGVPLFYKKEFLGAFGVHYLSKKHGFNDEEVALIKDIANQMATAIYQAKLYEKMQDNAKIERVIRTIIQKAISTENEEEIIKTIVTEEGKLFKADRCFFIEYDSEFDTVIPIKEYAEYLSSKNIKSHVERVPQKHEVESFLRETKQNKIVVVENIEKIKLPDATKKMLIDGLGVKSYLIAPVFYGDKLFGFMVLHYVNDFVQFTFDQINTAQIIANQSASILYQAKLHLKNKLNAKREKILRKIISMAMKTFDFSHIKQIVNDVGKITKADRCYFVETDLGGLKGKSLDYESEYLASADIKSIIGYQFPEQDVRDFVELYINAKDLVYFDYENLRKMTEVKYEGIKKYSSLFDLKSGIGVPFMYEGKPVAVLCIEYVKEKVLPDTDELDFLRLLGQQVGILYTQIKLYNDLKKTADRERIIGNIISTAISTFDFSNIKKIVKDIGKMTKADRCYFVEAIPNTLQGIPVEYENEYLSSPEIKSIKDYNFPYEDVKEFINCYIEAKDVVSFDYESIQNFSDAKYDGIKKYANLFDLKCSIGIPFFYESQLVAILIIEYVKKKYLPEADELDFLRILGNQIGMAYSQIKLYNESKKTAEREKILRDISNKIRSSLDIEKIKKEIVTQLGTFFNADRVAMAHYDYIADNYIITPESEYRSSDKVKTFVGQDFVNFPGFAKYIRDFHFKGKNIIFNNLEEYIDENQLRGTGVDEFYSEYGFASSAAINVYYEDTFLGNLVITFEKQKDITNDEINFLNVISDQIGVALHQAELYLQTRQQAEREILLRKIIEAIRSSLDINEIIHTFVFEIGKILKAKKVFYSKYDKLNNTLLTPDENSEYRESSDILKYSDMSDILDDNFPIFTKIIETNKQTMIIPDIAKFLKEKGLENSIDTESTSKYNFNTAIAFPVVSQGKLLGFYGIEYTDATYLGKSTIDFLTTLSEQTVIAMNQAELYNKEKQTVQREILLRKIISDIRSSLDIEEILDYICKESARLFNVQRVTIISLIDKNNYSDFKVRKEYKTSPDRKCLHDVADFSKAAEYWWDNLINKNRTMAVDNIEESDAPDAFKNAYRSLEIKAIVGSSIMKGDEVWGCLVLSEYENYRHWTTEEITLLNSISDQIYIAINQTELYQKQKETAERETLLRKIYETMRSSLDINVIKNAIVEEIGKALGADICFIIGYKSEDNKFETDVYSEYRSSEEEKSYVGYDLQDENVKFFINMLKETREIFSPNTEEFISNNKLEGTPAAEHLRKYKIKSGYGEAIYYGDTLFGYIVVQFTQQYKELTPDELSFLKTITAQAGIAFYQASLYKKIQKQAEREKINRSIIEILRNTFDKNYIKNIFVRTIGNFFKADRVFLSEYDPELIMYKAVEPGSEFLSSINEKSFVGYDWTCSEASEYIEPLLSKKELNIPNWDEYIKNNIKGHDFISLFVDANVKSSYNFPILYQERLMGYFCIEFTQRYFTFEEDDMTLIRGICRQCGIALYQAELYQKAQDNAQAKITFSRGYTDKIRDSLNEIIDLSNISIDQAPDPNELIGRINMLSKNLREFTNEMF